MSKRCGFSLIVFVAIGFANSEAGIDGNGVAVSVQSAEEWEKCLPLFQMLYLRYLGQISCARSLFAIAMFLSVAQVLAPLAGMFEAAIVC